MYSIQQQQREEAGVRYTFHTHRLSETSILLAVTLYKWLSEIDSPDQSASFNLRNEKVYFPSNCAERLSTNVSNGRLVVTLLERASSARFDDEENTQSHGTTNPLSFVIGDAPFESL